jgi:hypothetical protein
MVPAALTALVPIWFLALAFALGYVIYRDADARGSARPLAWSVGSLLTNGLVALLYLRARSEIGGRERPRAGAERALVAFVLGSLVAWLVAATVAPPDPVSQAIYAAVAAAVAVPLVALVGRVRASGSGGVGR